MKVFFTNKFTENNFPFDKDFYVPSLSKKEVDLYSCLIPYIKQHSKPKESQTIYRVQHQKADQTEELVTSLLPLLDSFEMLLKFASSYEGNEILGNWMSSMEGIYKRLKKVLLKQGLQPVEALGVPVDFAVHEVVEYRYIPDGIPNIVIEEQLKGYTYRGRLIRESRVVVSNADGG